MATIPDLTEQGALGTNAAHVTTGNSVFDTFGGGSSSTQPTWTNTSHTAPLALLYTLSTNDAYCNATCTATGSVYTDFFINVATLPSGNSIIWRWYNGTTVLGDIQLSPLTGTTYALKLRTTNGSGTASSLWTSAALNVGDWNGVAVRCTPGASGTMQMKIYSGANLDTATASQDSGAQTPNQTLTTIDSIRVGFVANVTATLSIANIRSDDAAFPSRAGGGGGGGGTAITAWSETFEGGVAGNALTSATSFISSHTGGFSGTFFADPYDGALACRSNPTAAADNYRIDLSSPVATAWVKFRVKVVTMPAASTSIWNIFSTTTNQINELRVVPGSGVFQLQIRNGTNTQVAISGNLALNVYHEVALFIDPTNTKARLRVYSSGDRGTGTPTYDSTLLTSVPQGGATTANLMRFGLLSSDTADIRFDTFAADTTTEPAGISPPGGTTVTATIACDIAAAAEPYSTGTLTFGASGGSAPYTFSPSQTAGTTAALSGSGSSRTFTVPPVQNGDTLTYSVTSTDNAAHTSAAVTVNVTVLDQNHYYRHSGTLTPWDWKYRHGGNLV